MELSEFFEKLDRKSSYYVMPIGQLPQTKVRGL